MYEVQNETMSFKDFVNQIQINEKLGKSADMGDYIDDFQKSDSPQFKGKSKEKRKDMAIAAYLDKKDKSEGAYGYEKQDPDVKDKKGTQPAKYYKGMSKSTKQKRDAHFKSKKAGPAPGDADAKTKPSVHTKKFKQMYGEDGPCWDTHKQVGMKKKGGKMVPNCVPKNEDVCCEECETEALIIKENIYRVGSEAYFQYFVDLKRDQFDSGDLYYTGFDKRLMEGDIGKFAIYEGDYVPLDCPMMESEYQGKDVELNKPKAGGPKKYYVYVKDPSTGNIKKFLGVILQD